LSHTVSLRLTSPYHTLNFVDAPSLIAHLWIRETPTMTLQYLFLLTDNSPPEYNDFTNVMVIVLNTFSLKRSVMQLFYFIKTPLLLLILLSCNKDKTDFSNITLKDKPLNQIKSAIRGRWQLHYSYGGITGNVRHNYTNSFIEFKTNDSLYWE
jgi:hypothetical protein